MSLFIVDRQLATCASLQEVSSKLLSVSVAEANRHSVFPDFLVMGVGAVMCIDVVPALNQFIPRRKMQLRCCSECNPKFGFRRCPQSIEVPGRSPCNDDADVVMKLLMRKQSGGL